MDKYKVGTVFELYENDEQEYIIVDNMEKDKWIYLLVTPVYNESGRLKTDYTKIMLLRVHKENEEIDIETDEKVIAEMVDNTLKRIENEE